ncbi:MAG: DUF1917 domain-containing protein, partial [Phycisphaerae bacterium]|nr:DUF1917 domain-containing protein [candidate division KSB1 bacterium]NIR64414.1 DUF1917 domain-containing protein [candidate division Zixibacteria bacterium]NIV00877.1 DUF1917 domain-containing protein [Phycisphaerae bacterium]NIU25294.1 DUF1917 domain-containing protein [candidate division KSB1 bacterium]NIW19142.1 DUF1917 domain-containing protein [candidate division KSB1 bacterium]
DEVWGCVKLLVDEKEVFGAKVSTKWGHAARGGDNYVIVVYTPNYLDVEDVFRVREVLRDRCGVESVLYYKPDLYTKKRIYADTARDLGLPGASRFSG